MNKDLIKLANDLDIMGYVKLANKIDNLLKLAGALYDVPSNWGNKDTFSLVRPEAIVQHYYDIANRKGTPEALQSYIVDNDVLDWQKEKVISAVTSDSRWSGNTPTPDVVPESSMSTSESVMGPEVTAEDFHKLLIADKDDGTPYKMSNETFRLGSRGYITSGPLPALRGKLTDQELEIIKSSK